MSVGASLLDLFGQTDPRARILQAMQGGAGGQPAGGVQAGAGADPAAGTAGQPGGSAAGVQAMQDNVDSYKSPADLASLYKDLLKMNNRAANIDRGMGLIGSAISRDGNREATMSAFTGENAPNASAGMDQIASSILEFNKAQVAQTQRASALASLPAIASKYGLSPETARYLFETGKLEDVIKEAEKPNRQLKDLGDGRVALIDLNDNQQVGVFGDPKDARTDDMKEYDAASKDPAFKDYMVDMKEAGSQKTTNNIINKEQNKFQEKYGELQGERLDKMVNAGENAGQMLDMLDLVEQGLNTDVTTGALGPTEQSLRRMGQYLGLDTDPEKVAGGELITSVQNKMALLMRHPDSGMGMPGSVSDRDLQFLKDAQVGLDKTPLGNKMMLEAFRRLEKRKIEIADMAENYAEKNGTLRGFQTQLREFSEKNPLFTKENFAIGEMDPEVRRKAINEKYGIK